MNLGATKPPAAPKPRAAKLVAPGFAAPHAIGTRGYGEQINAEAAAAYLESVTAKQRLFAKPNSIRWVSYSFSVIQSGAGNIQGNLLAVQQNAYRRSLIIEVEKGVGQMIPFCSFSYVQFQFPNSPFPSEGEIPLNWAAPFIEDGPGVSTNNIYFKYFIPAALFGLSPLQFTFLEGVDQL